MRTRTTGKHAASITLRASGPLTIAAALLFLGGCSANVTPPGNGASADSVGSSPGTGTSDTDCRIVLREFGPSTINGGEAFTDSTGASFMVFRGVIDVDSALAGDTVSIWYQAPGYSPVIVQATQCSGNCGQGLESLNGGQNPPSGFTRYSFATQADTVEEGTDGMYSLQFIPYLTDANGNSTYDHNRVGGNYTINGDSQNYAITDDFTTCPSPDPQGLVSSGSGSTAGNDAGAGTATSAQATLNFTNGAVSQSGLLVPGAQVAVDYDITRLPQCRDTNGVNGNPGWNITGYAQLNSEPAVSFYVAGVNPTGAPPPSYAFTVDAPGTLQVWFTNTDVSGCNQYDSNYGQNWQFTVTSP